MCAVPPLSPESEGPEPEIARVGWLERLRGHSRRVRELRGLKRRGDSRTLLEILDGGAPYTPMDRSGAAQYLGELGAGEAVDALVRHVKRDHELVRALCARALGRIGDPRAVPALIRALRDSNTLVRTCAIEGLGEIGDPVAVPHLMPFLSDKSWMTHRGSAIYALSLIRDPIAQRAAQRQLLREGWSKRCLIAKALRRQRRRGCVPSSG